MSDRELQAKVRTDIRAKKDRNFAEAHAGAAMLDELWERLQPYQRGYEALIDKGPRQGPMSIEIRRELNTDPVARWTRDGGRLFFASSFGRAEASTVDEAMTITFRFLEGDTGATSPRSGLGFLG